MGDIASLLISVPSTWAMIHRQCDNSWGQNIFPAMRASIKRCLVDNCKEKEPGVIKEREASSLLCTHRKSARLGSRDKNTPLDAN